MDGCGEGFEEEVGGAREEGVSGCVVDFFLEWAWIRLETRLVCRGIW